MGDGAGSAAYNIRPFLISVHYWPYRLTQPVNKTRE